LKLVQETVCNNKKTKFCKLLHQNFLLNLIIKNSSHAAMSFTLPVGRADA